MILPCIDLMSGKVVQLVQGNPKNKKFEEADPLAKAKEFAGFTLQVIDLDAAMGKGSNLSIIKELCSRHTCRVGGGVRSAEKARELVSAGAEKVIIGSSAFSGGKGHASFLQSLADAVGKERILIAIDSKEGKVVVSGWTRSTGLAPVAVVKKLEPYCSGVLYTYVDKEGMMEGTDIATLRKLRAATQLEITAAGGISSKEEIMELEKMGINSALGMALYMGRIRLRDFQ